MLRNEPFVANKWKESAFWRNCQQISAATRILLGELITLLNNRWATIHNIQRELDERYLLAESNRNLEHNTRFAAEPLMIKCVCQWSLAAVVHLLQHFVSIDDDVLTSLAFLSSDLWSSSWCPCSGVDRRHTTPVHSPSAQEIWQQLITS